MNNTYSLYTQLIVNEALAKNIQVSPISNVNKNGVILSYHNHSETIYQSMTDKIGAATAKFISDKAMLNSYLLDHGYPAPNFILTSNLSEAIGFLHHYGALVVKPLGQTGGKGITTNITDETQLETAITFARSLTTSFSQKIICQQHVEGDDHRILIIDYKHIFAIKRVPAYVVGNGVDTVETLIDTWNDQLPFFNRSIPKSPKTAAMLDKQNLTFESVIPTGELISLSDVANSHAGGISIDVTDSVSSELSSLLLRLCTELKIPVAGIDIVSSDISKNIGKIIEINVTPGLSIHHFPTQGQPRNPAEKIVEMLFPEV